MKKYLIITITALLLVGNQSKSLFAEQRTQRIISLTPATTEILFSLSLDDQIIGVTTFCNYPPEAITKEKVGTFSQPNIEKIVLLKPDIIFATGLEQAHTVERLRQLQLRVVVSHPATIDELFSSIAEIGTVTHREKEAQGIIDAMKKKIEVIAANVAHIAQEEKPEVFIEIWHDPLMTAGKGSFVDELITLAGGINIAGDTPRPYSYFSAEQVIIRNPDCIILGYMDSEQGAGIAHRLGWGDIKAVQRNRVYSDIDPDVLLRPGPRLAQGLYELHQRFYAQ
ncbi:ABC transporter substrate-binding protein [Candidatus Omnitrophota bacterium]